MNLLSIYAALEGVDVKKVDQLFVDDNMASFKNKLANKIIDKVCPIGEAALKMCAHEEDRLLEILDKGAIKAKETADKTLHGLKAKAGILRRL